MPKFRQDVKQVCGIDKVNQLTKQGYKLFSTLVIGNSVEFVLIKQVKAD